MDTLKELIVGITSPGRFPIAPKCCKGTATLVEDKCDMEVTVKDLPIDSIIFKCSCSQGAILKDKFRKICDYFIFYKADENLNIHVLLCELKEDLNKRTIEKAMFQLKCTIPLLKYLLSAIYLHESFVLDESNTHEKTVKVYPRFLIIGSCEEKKPTHPDVPSIFEEECRKKGFGVIASSDNSVKLKFSRIIEKTNVNTGLPSFARISKSLNH